METVYAADKNVTGFDVSWNRTTVPWIARMLPMCTSPDWTKLQHILWLDNKHGWEERKLADASATTVQNIPDSDISLNDVSFTSMTVHMETVYAEDKNVTGFDVSGFHTVPWTVRMLNVYITGLDEATTYTFGWKNPQESAKTRRTPVQPRTEYPRFSRYFAQRRVFTSMTVHMETVYAADKNVTVRRFLDSRMTVPWIVRIAPMSTSTDWTKHTYTFFGWAKIRRNQRNSADASAT
jgi:hypothetical protein